MVILLVSLNEKRSAVPANLTLDIPGHMLLQKLLITPVMVVIKMDTVQPVTPHLI
jgi:hypothetical protein